jgi:histidinol-phosphate aminotransferase
MIDRIGRLIRPEIRALQAYRVPEASGLVKLDAMENPYAWPAPMKVAWLEALRDAPLNRYPDPQASALRARLREAFRAPAGMDVLLGNGSDELIQLIQMAVARPGAAVMAPVPTFVMYDMIATFAGLRFVGVALGPDFSLDLPAMQQALREHRPAVVFLAWPNNPTGNLFDDRAVEAIVREAPGLVVVDEAYHAFAGRSFLDRLDRFDNLLVMRTMSKQGLAGLRLGMLFGRPEWLHEFDKLRLPYNINVLTQLSAGFALDHLDELDRQAALIREERGRVFAALSALPGLTVWPSDANFVLFRVPGAATPVHERLRRAGVLVKNLDGTLPGCLRVTIGTPAENDAFLAALRTGLVA